MTQDINIGLNPIPVPLENFFLYKMFTEHFASSLHSYFIIKMIHSKLFIMESFKCNQRQSDCISL